MSPKEIIEFVLHKEKLTYYALAKAMGLGRTQALYDIRDGKVKAISGNFARKILEAFPNSGYTLAFLFTGDEKLLETSPFSGGQEKETKDDIIKRQESQIEFLKEVISIKEREIVDKDFAISELTKKIKILEGDLANRNLVQKKEKTA